MKKGVKMVTPTKSEIAKKERDYHQHLKKLDEDGRIKDNLAITSLRSAIRKEWMRNPAKLAVLYEAMQPDMDNSTRTKWLFKCAVCNGLFKLADVEVDHIKGEHSLSCAEDFVEFYNNILRVKKSGLQVLCKDDHAIKTYSERYNVTWEEAVSKKKVIQKLNQTASEQKKELRSYGFKASEIANETLREKAYEQLLKEGKI